MENKFSKMMVAGLVLALSSICLMGCEPSEKAEFQLGPDVTDADGNVYPSVKIGNQIWMAKNLNVKTKGSMCYDNDPANCEKYGRLYTWEAAKVACPDGWHLPSREEFNTFLDVVKVRVDQIVSQKKLYAEPLKNREDEFDNHLHAVGWEEGFNTFGFSALPAGIYHGDDKEFYGLGKYAEFWASTERSFLGCFAHYWSSTERSLLDCLRYFLTSKERIGHDSYVLRSNSNSCSSGSPGGAVPVYSYCISLDLMFFHENDKGSGYSVRCLKDSN